MTIWSTNRYTNIGNILYLFEIFLLILSLFKMKQVIPFQNYTVVISSSCEILDNLVDMCKHCKQEYKVQISREGKNFF